MHALSNKDTWELVNLTKEGCYWLSMGFFHQVSSRWDYRMIEGPISCQGVCNQTYYVNYFQTFSSQHVFS